MADPDEQQLAIEARELFESYFAAPYREGRQVPVGPDRTKRAALLPYDYLVRKGFIVHTSSPGVFRISDKGKELAFREHAIPEALGIVTHVSIIDSGEGTFDAGAVRARARSIFQEHFGACDRDRNVIPRGSLDVAACEELARKGLAEKVGHGGPFMIGHRGIEVCMGESNLDQVLGPSPSAVPSEQLSTTVNVFHGPIGAVAAAAGAVAHGAVNIRHVDEALKKTIELQDQLGELTDTLLPLLRHVRKEEGAGTTEAQLLAQIADTKEFQDFEKAVKPGLARHAIQATASVLELVPVLKAALSLLGGQ